MNENIDIRKLVCPKEAHHRERRMDFCYSNLFHSFVLYIWFCFIFGCGAKQRRTRRKIYVKWGKRMTRYYSYGCLVTSGGSLYISTVYTRLSSTKLRSFFFFGYSFLWQITIDSLLCTKWRWTWELRSCTIEWCCRACLHASMLHTGMIICGCVQCTHTQQGICSRTISKSTTIIIISGSIMIIILKQKKKNIQKNEQERDEQRTIHEKLIINIKINNFVQWFINENNTNKYERIIIIIFVFLEDETNIYSEYISVLRSWLSVLVLCAFAVYFCSLLVTNRNVFFFFFIIILCSVFHFTR